MRRRVRRRAPPARGRACCPAATATCARWRARVRASASAPGRRRRGPRASTRSSTPRGASGARARPGALRADRRRRRRRRLGRPRRPPRAGGRRADRARAARLHLRGPGTDLRLGLAPGTVWHGGTLPWAPRGRFSPNVPTEEVFTSPSPRGDGGDVHVHPAAAARGPRYRGAARRLRRGGSCGWRPTRTRTPSYLRTYLERDRGGPRWARSPWSTAAAASARRGGRTAPRCSTRTPPATSPSGRGSRSAPAAVRQPGERSQGLHVDVMIGSPELEVTGLDADGREVPVLGGGAFA